METLRRIAGLSKANPYEKYQSDPVLYAQEVLKVGWWSQQEAIARALIKHKRVIVKASHSIGKTHIAGGLVNWFYDCFDPGICLTTAPTLDSVKDILWKEVRIQGKHNASQFQPKAPRIESSPDHFAVGYTASSDAAFQGRHEDNVLIVFDEAIDIDAPIWDAAEGMMTGDNCFWLVIFNPTDTSTRAYDEETSGRWHSISVSALDHPNILAECEGRPERFGSLSLGWVRDRIHEWCTPIPVEDATASDIEFEGKWYKPGSLAESKLLGRWPTSGSNAVWNESIWKACLTQQFLDPSAPLEIGCDVARFGDDFTSIHVHRGNCSLHHETHNGWDTVQTAGRLKQLAKQFCINKEEPMRILVKIDDDGVGGGVTDNKGFYNFVGVSGANKSVTGDYPNMRSETWFATAGRANEGRIDLSRLDSHSLNLIRKQVMSPTWKLDEQGRRKVEPKADTKKRIQRSPDDADAFNLAYGTSSGIATTVKSGKSY